MRAIKLYSDNFNGDLLTEGAYNEVCLQMSTGDFHTHKISRVTVRAGTPVTDVAALYGGEVPDLAEMYGQKNEVLDTYRWAPHLAAVLFVTRELNYFKNGKANMHVEKKYRVEVWLGLYQPHYEGSTSFTNKAEAKKYFKALKGKYRKAGE